MKYEQLKKNLKTYEETYDGLIKSALQAARLAIIDLEDRVKELEVGENK